MKFQTVKLKSILLVTILILLSLPFLQSRVDIIKLKPLKGAVTQPEKVIFDFNAWFSAEYQEKEETYLNESFGFRSWFIRVNNQIAFSFFNKAKAKGVIIGKENYLYEENYIKAYYGTDFIGNDSITHRLQRVKYLQDTLNKLNKSLILVFAAGKGSFYPEFFPDEYKTEKGTTNYEVHIKLAKELLLNFIDFNEYFLQNKYTSPYPLYPQFGIHWSDYSSYFVADSMIQYIEKLRSIDMPNIIWDDIKVQNAHGTDVDIADGMNLIFSPKSFKMAYPKIHFQVDSNKIKPSVLVIADSYFWQMYNFGISNLFTTTHFWFYNNQIYPESFQSPLNTSQVNLSEQIAQHDVIIILATEATLPEFGWGFIENAYELYQTKKSEKTNSEFQKRLAELINEIKADEKWMEKIEEKASQRNISVDSMLIIDATWVITQNK